VVDSRSDTSGETEMATTQIWPFTALSVLFARTQRVTQCSHALVPGRRSLPDLYQRDLNQHHRVKDLGGFAGPRSTPPQRVVTNGALGWHVAAHSEASSTGLLGPQR
jgi:hypothetical protein